MCKRKTIIRFIGAVFIISVLSGCATLLNGNSQNVWISSAPVNAGITIYDSDREIILKGSTPLEIQLEAGERFLRPAEYWVVIEQDGYEPFETRIRGRLSGLYIFGNLITWNVIGWFIVDPLTGAMWELQPYEIKATLREK